MLFLRRKHLNNQPKKPEGSFIYWFMESLCVKDYQYCFDLNYSGEVGDLDFPNICIAILEKLLSDYWVSTKISDSCTRNFLLPDGVRSGPKESFPIAFAQYLARNHLNIPFLIDKKSGDAITFSKGIPKFILQSYLSDVSPEFPLRWVEFCAYKEPFSPNQQLTAEEKRQKENAWDVLAKYEECQDHLAFFVKESAIYDTTDIPQLVRQICDKYGKELHIINSDRDPI